MCTTQAFRLQHSPRQRVQVKAFCRENMTGYKQPRLVEFRDELPKSNVGKILRKELRDSAAAN